MPVFQVEGEPWVMDTAQLAAVPRKTLGHPVADLSDERHTITSALDMLISGI
jgi:toxin CcdB